MLSPDYLDRISNEGTITLDAHLSTLPVTRAGRFLSGGGEMIVPSRLDGTKGLGPNA